MMSMLKTNSLGFQVCLFFAAHPQRVLSSVALADMFDDAHIAAKLQMAVKSGFLSAEGGRGQGHLRMYRAGDRLKQLISKEVPR